MERAAVLIGVSRSGGLDHLPAVGDCIDAMEEWALAQEMTRESVIRVTDIDGGVVTAADVRKAIKTLCDRGTIGQLIVYFAGHGVYQRYSEYWLLSDAPDDPQAAINLHGTVELARMAGVSEVVFIADACRTGGSGIEMSNVTGSEVFPNAGPAGGESPVAIFFGAELGYAAHQVKAPGAADPRYRGVFTEVMVSVLSGKEPALLERGGAGEEGFAFVRARRSHTARLKRLVGKKLDELQVDAAVFQNPVVRPESEESWIARFEWHGGGEQSPGGMPGAGGDEDDGAYTGEVAAHDSVGEQLRSLRRRELSVDEAGMPGADGVGELADGVLVVAAPNGAGQADGLVAPVEAVLSLEGATLTEAISPDAAVLDPGSRGALLKLERAAAGSVFAVTDDGRGVILPIVERCLTRAAFVEGELRDVAVGSRSARPSFRNEQLRGLLAAASRVDALELDADEVDALAAAALDEDGLDPILALLAATAFSALRRRDLVAEAAVQVQRALGVQLFDLALLTGALDGTVPGDREGVIPAAPLLTRHWSMLGARNVSLDPDLAALESHLTASVWTQLDEQGVEIARRAFGRA
ncbi:caspase family protein [Microbacterium sp. Root180]|uniref:caspase family protein n=1 Tax=Microbacterium sp. Root180 TaxID=1736483 RepID=UPI0006FAC267|nr:caspase family protein [Microbacterium sp. Root180]KRB36652.1 hypothetical protein ASD93_11415 [Microbacterium sp. Root180]